jgi:siroheme synthase (precorrin-2 oxidase/ferrochelatase)
MAIGMPSMQDTELTVEDVLNLHQYWITKLYIEERRTTEQIVRLLKERRLIVTYVHGPDFFSFYETHTQ